MPIELVMPRLGWTMEEGTLAEWIKRDGDTVAPGDILYTVETDKALNEVESFDSGILRIPPDSPAPGVTVPVGALLAYILAPGETAPWETASSATAGATEASSSTPAPVTADTPTNGRAAPDRVAAADAPTRRAGPTISPRARRVAAELGVDWLGLRGSGRTGRIVERDIRAAAARPAAAEVRVSPLARRLAEEKGVDLDALAAAMPGRRIERAHVEDAARAAPAPTAPTSTPATPAHAAPTPAAPTAPTAGAPMSRIRRLTADRMAHSAHTAAPVTLTTEADATELVRLRDKLKADLADAAVPSYTDLLARLVAVALRDHPALNASLDGDAIVEHPHVHIGIAVDTDRGLLVPVIRDAHIKSVHQIAADAAHLVVQARAGRAAPDSLQGGTFTITNLGMYDIDAFTPIINLPECAILGVGRIVPRQVVVDEAAETVAIRKMMALSLTFDHRLVDGAPAARFLQHVKRFIERPHLWLIR